MIYINKGNEPLGLREHKSKPYASYSNLSKDTLDSIRESLLIEQGYICAYCMKRIEKDNMKIEHYISQNPPNEKSLDYSNMLGVCPGNMGSGGKNKTCDTHRSIENKSLTVNPLERASIAKINYKSDGEINSTDTNINYDIFKTLNLNHEYLKDERRIVLRRFQKSLLESMPRKGNWNRDKLLRLRNKYLSINSGRLDEYVGIIIYFLDKKLK